MEQWQKMRMFDELLFNMKPAYERIQYNSTVYIYIYTV